MKYSRKFIILLFFSFCFYWTAWATDYYVDSNSGNDSWDGLYPTYQGGSNGPWKTLIRVNSATINPGDTVNLRRVSIWYAESDFIGFIVNWNGTANSPIILQPYGSGDKPIICGGTIETEWIGPDENGVYYKVTSYGDWLLEDYKALNLASDATCSDGNWYKDASKVYYKPTTGVPGDHILIRLVRPGINLYAANGQSVSYIIIDGIKFFGKGVVSDHTSKFNLHDITIKNCDFAHARDTVTIYCRYYPGLYENITVKNNTFDYSRFGPLFSAWSQSDRGFNNVIISGNKITHSNMLIYGGRWQTPGQDTNALYLQNLRNSIIEHNDISGICDGKGAIEHWAHANFNSTGVVFRYNYIHDILGAGITWGGDGFGTNSAEIYGNIIINCGTGTTDSIYGGLRLRNTQSAANPSKVYNNVIINADRGVYAANTNKYIFKNNIITSSRVSHVAFNTSPIGDNTLDFNCYYPDVGVKFQVGPNNYNFSGWKNATGQDANSFVSDPKLINPDGGDFRLDIGSPCIKAGTDVGLDKDYHGNSWRNPPSMGAIEYFRIGGVISLRTIGGAHYKPKP